MIGSGGCLPRGKRRTEGKAPARGVPLLDCGMATGSCALALHRDGAGLQPFVHSAGFLGLHPRLGWGALPGLSFGSDARVEAGRRWTGVGDFNPRKTLAWREMGFASCRGSVLYFADRQPPAYLPVRTTLPMDYKVEGNDSELVVRIIGEVTAESYNELRNAVVELIRRKPTTITLDLAEMPFIDTSGLGVLVGLRAQAKKSGTSLMVKNPQPRIMQVFRITQLAKVFGLAD